MPNGGVLPSCDLCQYATGAAPQTCQRHAITLFDPTMTFCPDLRHPRYPTLRAPTTRTYLARWLRLSWFSDKQLYAWVTLGYQDRARPTLPLYRHVDRPLASLRVYRTWTREQARAAMEELRRTVLHDSEHPRERTD